MTTQTDDPATDQGPATVADYAQAWWARTRGGDFGAIPIVVGGLDQSFADAFRIPANMQAL